MLYLIKTPCKYATKLGVFREHNTNELHPRIAMVSYVIKPLNDKNCRGLYE